MMSTVTAPRFIWLEYCCNFLMLPALLSMLKLHGGIYLVLTFISYLSWRILQKQFGYRWRSEWNWQAMTRKTVKSIVVRFLPFAAALLIFTSFMIPDHLFSLPRERPQVWVMVLILYPILSVIPQEVLFRSYFFKRYETVPHKARIAINAFAFGWVHIVLQNWVAVIFSGIGAILFADTYLKTKSLAVVCFEHALYGCWIFTIGLGYYFYHGQAVH